MSQQSISPAACGNRLLSGLHESAFSAIEPSLSRVHLHRKDVVGERGSKPAFVYFPRDAVLSVLAFMNNGAAVEVGTIGREGFFGIEVLLGGKVYADTTVCQIDGDSFRMPAAVFRDAISGDTPLRRVALRYLLTYLNLVSQSVACNRLHNIEERFARWILMMHDRVNGDEFYLTQEFIADMLGVHRPSVSLVAGAFQQAGFIRYHRGRMSILDREGLENASCECYAASAAQIEELCTSIGDHSES